MKKLTQQKWFLWLTDYWFLFPVIGFLLFEAGVFFYFGKQSHIAVHDNLDLFQAQFQMLKNTGSFFSHGVDVPFLGGISRDTLPSEFSLYSVLYMLFPAYTAYVLGLLTKVLIAIVSFRLLAGELYPQKVAEWRPLIYMTGFIYGILHLFPAFSFAFASMPLVVYLLIRIYRKPSARLYLALFLYPLLSYFSYMGLFILGYLLLGFLWVSVKDKKPVWRLLLAFLVLSLGYVVCEYRLFGQMLLSNEVTIRSSMRASQLSFSEVLKEMFVAWKDGVFHAEGMQNKLVLPICILYLVVRDGYLIYKKRAREILRDPVHFLMLFTVFNSIVYGLYYCESVRKLVETILPPLKGWQFNRTIFFNPFLWYAALFLILAKLYDKGIAAKWIANVILCVAALIIIVTPSTFNDLCHTCYDRLYAYRYGSEVDDLNYEQFYAEPLFEQIKEDIGYAGEWSAAYGLHPAVLQYNGIATLDGYLGFYSEQYKTDFRKIIAPALERVEETRIYYDDWGARAYLYSGTDSSIVQATRSIHATDRNMYIDSEAFRALNGTYIFSRWEIENAGELHLELENVYQTENIYYTIYLYRVV